MPNGYRGGLSSPALRKKTFEASSMNYFKRVFYFLIQFLITTFPFPFFTESQTTYIVIYSPFTIDTYKLHINNFQKRLFSCVHCLIPDCMVCMMGVLKYGGSHSSINQSRYHLTLYKRLPQNCVHLRIAQFCYQLLKISVKDYS